MLFVNASTGNFHCIYNTDTKIYYCFNNEELIEKLDSGLKVYGAIMEDGNLKINVLTLGRILNRVELLNIIARVSTLIEICNDFSEVSTLVDYFATLTIGTQFIIVHNGVDFIYTKKDWDNWSVCYFNTETSVIDSTKLVKNLITNRFRIKFY